MAARLIFTFLFLISAQGFAGTSSSPPDTTSSTAEKLERIHYLPNMLPLILKNRDIIGLTDEQVGNLEKWRSENMKPMLQAMKTAASKRLEIKQAALSPTVSSARLQQMQNDIFRLQREILQYKLSCRDNVVKTFNDENWDSFFMVLTEENIDVPMPFSYAGK